jgi:predicted NBD/HSP70 family sugar kinase
MAAYSSRSEGLVEKSAPVVISFPGPLHEDGSIVNAPTVSGLDNQIPDLRRELLQRSGRTVHILNDVTAATLYLARQSEWERLMVVTVSSGIGSKVCFCDSGKITVFDRGPYAGEIGHLRVDESEDAPVCDCGGRGHLGAIASGRGIERLAQEHAASAAGPFSESLCHSKFNATAQTLNNEAHLVPALRAGDSWSLRILEEGIRPLAVTLNTVMLALGLQGVLVIGGFAFGIGEKYLELLRRVMRDRCDYSALHFFPEMIRFGEMCEEACLRGAAEYAVMVRNGRP